MPSNPLEIAIIDSPLGLIEIKGDAQGIQVVSFRDETATISSTIPKNLQNCVTQLQEYFSGSRRDFSILLNPQGTEFQRKVWQILQEIPAGKTRSYLDQAKAYGDLKAIRAIASANGKNPISILIPCHRVIGTDGSLTGYAGGLWRKKWLLEHENPSKQQRLF
ncbi:MAG: cysteine methyltransferase [Flavobacteriaceae bacterium]|nr:cysteine methyltransferase [Flavobacteriaceae bacterium]